MTAPRSLRAILLDCLEYIESDPAITPRAQTLVDEGHAALIRGPGKPPGSGKVDKQLIRDLGEHGTPHEEIAERAECSVSYVGKVLRGER